MPVVLPFLVRGWKKVMLQLFDFDCIVTQVAPCGQTFAISEQRCAIRGDFSSVFDRAEICSWA